MRKSKISKERREKLSALARLMNKQNITSIPVTRELLDCFDVAITKKEADFLLRMGTENFTYEQISSLSDLPERSFRTFLEAILKKGLVWTRINEKEEESYTLAPILVGWFELYLSDGADTPQKREFARSIDRLFRSWGKFNVYPIRSLWNYHTKRRSRAHRRVVVPQNPSQKAKTVEIAIDRPLRNSDMEVHLTESVNELIEKYGKKNKIALVHCFCRQWRKFVGEPCRFGQPYESCIVLGDFTSYVVKYGIARYVSKEEALRIIQEVQDKGAVHQVFHEREDIKQPEIAICNCCWDCCGILGSYNRGLLPMRVKSYYLAQIIDDSLCTGCGTCAKYCPTRAVYVINKKSQIDVGKCIGCGQCELQCPEGVIALEYKEREVVLPLLRKSEARL